MAGAQVYTASGAIARSRLSPSLPAQRVQLTLAPAGLVHVGHTTLPDRTPSAAVAWLDECTRTVPRATSPTAAPRSRVRDNPRVMTHARTIAGGLPRCSCRWRPRRKGRTPSRPRVAHGRPAADLRSRSHVAADAAERLDPRRHPRAVRRRPRPLLGDPHAVEPHAAGDRRGGEAAHRRLLHAGAAGAGAGPRGQGAAGLGRPGRGLHVVRPGARHLHRPQRLRLDGHEQRHARDEVHAGGQAPAHDRRAGREQGQQRSGSPRRTSQLLRRAEDQRALHRRRLHQQARRRVRRGDWRLQTALGRVRQAPGRHGEVHLPGEARAPAAAVPRRCTALSGRRTASSTCRIAAAIASRCSGRTAST